MTREQLLNAARVYASRYSNERLVLATAFFDEKRGHLIASYFFDRVPNDDDKEECELFCGELAGEFPEIRTAETSCALYADTRSDLVENAVVAFSR